jgi:hypothetical protein
MQFDEVLRTFGTFFEQEQIRYALIGGLAVQSWGRSRLTKDVDFAVDRERQARVISFSESLGYETLYVSESFSNHAHDDPAWGRLDFMYVSGATAERIFSAATLRTVVKGAEAPVASPEHLAMMKALAMKNFPHRALFEGEDVRLLLNVPGVDRQAVRDYYERHGLLDLFDAIDRAR